MNFFYIKFNTRLIFLQETFFTNFLRFVFNKIFVFKLSAKFKFAYVIKCIILNPNLSEIENIRMIKPNINYFTLLELTCLHCLRLVRRIRKVDNVALLKGHQNAY